MATISISPSSTTIAAYGGEKKFTINTSGGTVSEFSVALDGSPTDIGVLQTGVNTFSLLIPTNYKSTSRSIKGTVLAKVGLEVATSTFTVTQSSATISVVDSTIDIPGENIEFYVKLNSNVILTNKLNFGSLPNWITYKTTSYSKNIQDITFVATVNRGATRSDLFYIYVVDGGVNIRTFSVTVTQSTLPVIAPIYSERSIISGSSEMEYHIEMDDNVIFAGKAYKYPDAASLSISLNDTIENFLSSSWLTYTGTLEKMDDYMKEFKIKTSDGGSYSYYFFNDWSYKGRTTSHPTFLSTPIINRIHPRQRIFASLVVPPGTTGILNEYVNGETTGTWPLEDYGGFTVSEFSPHIEAITCGDEIKYEILKNGSVVDTITYYVDNSNKEYALYYLNAAGGWDTLLIDGNVLKTDEITQEMYKKKAASTTDFSRVNYLNTITGKWTLYTGYLNDEEASKMHNLLESNTVYLQRFGENMVPVNITNKTCEYKTYSNQGKNKFYYTIEVEASTDKYRM